MSQTFFVSCSPSLLTVLVDELRALDITLSRETSAGVYFNGNLEQAYRICLWSRIANRVFIELQSSEAKNELALYQQIQLINWADHFDVDCSISINCNIVRSKIHNSHYAALKAKDAIVDQFRAIDGERPNVDTDNPDIRIMLYLFKNQLTVSLDLSGESLHRRAYRTEAGLAPLKENLAASLLVLGQWSEIAKAGGSCLDPMCGSATFLIEAAMMAADIAPGLNRSVFGFSRWKCHQPEIFETLLIEAQSRREQGLKVLPSIIGFDANQKIISTAKSNINRAGLEDYITVRHLGLHDFKVDNIKPGLMICNPPYGKRLSNMNRISALYSNLGQLIKAHLNNWTVAVLLADRNLDYELAMTAQKTVQVKNGALDCYFQFYGVPYLATKDISNTDKSDFSNQHSQGMLAFANRLRKNKTKLSKWARKNSVSCYRVYDVDIPEYAFAIDLYSCSLRSSNLELTELYCHIQEYQAPKHINADKVYRHTQEALHVVKDVFELDESRVFFKKRKRQKGTEQYQRFDTTENFYLIQEQQCRFLVNFTDYLDTGIFLDHRPVRQIIFDTVKNKHFLNLFSYTATVSVFAAKAGARSTLSVDMSKTYSSWARENFIANQLDFKTNKFEQADCITWLEHSDNIKRYTQFFDLIFIDPPTFSNSKRMTDVFDVQRDHVKILTQALKLLSSEGEIIFSTNYRGFKLQHDKIANVEIREITKKTIPLDYARNQKIHSCWQIRHKP